MLITEVWGTPLNLAPKVSTLLVPPSPTPGLEPTAKSLVAWVDIPTLPLLAVWPQGHFFNSLSPVFSSVNKGNNNRTYPHQVIAQIK